MPAMEFNQSIRNSRNEMVVTYNLSIKSNDNKIDMLASMLSYKLGGWNGQLTDYICPSRR